MATERSIVADGALAGRTVAVVGASSGIGLATARRLHDLGASVTALARRRAAMEEGLGAERVGSGRLRVAALDARDPRAVQEALGRLDALDALVVAAGTNVPERRLDELTPAGWREVVDTNLGGVFHVVAAALPALRAARGLVLVIGSVSGAWPDRSGPAYQAAKAGAAAFLRAAGLEEYERGSGVRFSLIAPGLVETPLLERRAEPPPPEQRERMLRPEDVAELCAVLAALPAGVHVAELTVLPDALQALGRTG